MTDALASAAVVSLMVFVVGLLFSAKQALAKRNFKRVALMFLGVSVLAAAAWIIARGQMTP
jgi:hypothetical protein